jgi:FkbM family methyltransferase
MRRDEFLGPLGLDPAKPTLLYLCSSRLIAPGELSFVRRWLIAVRGAASAELRDCNILIRPHPDIALLPDDVPLVRHRWPAAPHIHAHVATPFDDSRAVVLRTSYKDPDGLYESLVHSTAVVGLNTTAELEAGIVGRPVFTIAADDGDISQRPTLHFHYLTRAYGGFVSVASTLGEHVSQMEEALAAGADPAPIRAFVETFLRPHGIDRAVSPVLAAVLEERGRSKGRPEPGEPLRTAVEPVRTPEEDDVLRLGYKRARIPVRVTPEVLRRVKRGTVPIDRSTVEWLETSVGVGEVVYDVNAGFGAYTLVAATQRGATVIAFEAGYRAYAALCENVGLNGIQGAVVAVPLPLGDRDALAEVKYERGRSGYGPYGVRPAAWRLRPSDAVQPHVRTVCITRLDTAIERYALPRAHHLRLSPHGARGVLAGGTSLLAGESLRTIWAHLRPQDEAAVMEQLGAAGLRPAMRRVTERAVRILFARPC